MFYSFLQYYNKKKHNSLHLVPPGEVCVAYGGVAEVLFHHSPLIPRHQQRGLGHQSVYPGHQAEGCGGRTVDGSGVYWVHSDYPWLEHLLDRLHWLLLSPVVHQVGKRTCDFSRLKMQFWNDSLILPWLLQSHQTLRPPRLPHCGGIS